MKHGSENMRADVIDDCQEITVKAMSFPHQRGTILYACLPCDTGTVAGPRVNRMADKIHLVSALLEHLAGMEGYLWTDCHFPDKADMPIHVAQDLLGRPHLLLGGCEGPAVSFSEGGRGIWAALCGSMFDIGIDVAASDDFQSDYPLHRAFQMQELQDALRVTHGDVGKASAWLWSIKEAAVKALGCAFHLVDPRQICVYPAAAEKDGGYISTACLSGRALTRFPMMASRRILVRSLLQEKMWLSIALLNRHQVRTEKP